MISGGIFEKVEGTSLVIPAEVQVESQKEIKNETQNKFLKGSQYEILRKSLKDLQEFPGTILLEYNLYFNVSFVQELLLVFLLILELGLFKKAFLKLT